MIEIYNFNDSNRYPLSFKDGAYGGAAGDKDGITDGKEAWMIKYPKNLSEMKGNLPSYSSNPLSEFIGSHIYKILGFPVHETRLGEKRGKIVVACKDFAVEDSLLEIRTLKNKTSDELTAILENTHITSSLSHVVDLQELLIHLDKNPILSRVDGIKQRFFEQSIIDVFIANNDRNNGNWGILRLKDGSDRLAPIFDNGACLSTKMTERKIQNILSDEDELRNNAINVLTAYGYEEHHYNAVKYFEKVEGYPEFVSALIRLVPLIKSKMEEINNLIDDIPEKHVLESGEEVLVCSALRKRLYKNQLEIRLEQLLVPEYNKIMEKYEEIIQNTECDFDEDIEEDVPHL